jgi:2-C-methyl-D-erythritol 2,4-cyclodiphosphate synthase
MRIGQGYDIHRLGENRRLVLGGVQIPSALGEIGHSDGDVLIHAIIDALLGAAAAGDIGTLFPPSDPEFTDISSRILLKQTVDLILRRGFEIGNIDCTVVLEGPKLLPFREEIRKTLSVDLGVSEKDISIKAKTKEGLGAVGNLAAIEAYAVVLLNGEGSPE